MLSVVGKTGERLLKIYGRMFESYGPQYWWPSETSSECVIGTILTQNTSWTNVEKAIGQMKGEMSLTMAEIEKIPFAKLARLIKPSGYFNQKARRLKIFARFVAESYGGNIDKLLAENAEKLRETLLGIEGIGPETADSIVLYAAEKPSFVVDSYTKRITARHGLTDENASYGKVRELFMKNLPHKTSLFNEYHALIVRTAKDCCHKTKPECERCPLEADLSEG